MRQGRDLLTDEEAPKKLTMQDVLNRLIAIGALGNGGARGQRFISADMVHQEALFEVQEELSKLLLDVGFTVGKGSEKKLVEAFPEAFQAGAPR